MFTMSGYIDKTADVVNTSVPDSSKVWKQVFLKNCVLGENVNIGDFTRAEDSVFENRVGIQRNALIYSSRIGKYSYTGKNFTVWHTDIGAFCSISWNVGIGGDNHDYSRVTTHAFIYSPHMGLIGNNESSYERFKDSCKIGNDVWIGANAIICRNVVVGDGAVIGAGAVVTHDVAPYMIVAGVPARPIKRRFDDETVERLLRICWWEFDDEVIRNNFHLFSGKPTKEILERLESLKV